MRTALALALTIAVAAGARANSEPAVPAGLDPGGIAIALLGSGVDYTRAEIAGALARDGEGDPIAWDFTDNDIMPYAATGPGTADAAYFAGAGASIRLVIVKEPAANPAAIGHMAAFTIRTPARILVWPDGAPNRPDWPVLFQAAQRFADRLFIVPAPGAGQSGKAKPTDNIVFTTGPDSASRRRGALDLALNSAAILAAKPGLSPRDIKNQLKRLP